MKILYLGSFQENWSTETYIAKAFGRAGCEVVKLEESAETHESIVQAAAETAPDLFLFAKARFRGANQGWPQAAEPVCQLLAAVRPHVDRVACWLFDLLAREFAPERFQWASTVAAACDLFALTDGHTAPQLPNALVVRQGAPDDVDKECEWDVEPRWDVLFLGTPYRERQLLVEALGRRFGDGFKHVNDCRGADLTRLVRSARICVGPHYPHLANYWSNRLYVVTAHGGLFAAPPVPGMQREGWRSGENFLALPLDPEQMAAKLEEYVNRYDRAQLQTIRRNACTHANGVCRYDDRVRELIAALAMDTSRRGAEPPSPATPAEVEPTALKGKTESATCKLKDGGNDFPARIST